MSETPRRPLRQFSRARRPSWHDATADEEIAAAELAAGRYAGPATTFCVVCHAEIDTGDLCPRCERADEGLR